MDQSKLFQAAFKLTQAMDRVVDETLPQTIASVVKFHSKGAAVGALGVAWLPGAGSTAALAISAGFIWSMYARINKEIGLPFSENIIKTVASGVATNLAAGALASFIVSSALSFLPGLGSASASAIMCGTCYALTLASGFVYLKILTRIFQAKSDPTTFSADKLKEVAKQVVQEEDIKSVMKEAKEEYKAAKNRGEINNACTAP